MKHFFKVALVVALSCAVLGAAVATHESHQKQLQTEATNAAARQADIEAVDAHNLQAVQVQATNLQNELNTSRSETSALCGFIAQHVSVKTTPYPAECQ